MQNELSRVRASFGLLVGVTGLALSFVLRTQGGADTAWCGGALALAVASALAAWVTKPERDPWMLLGMASGAAALAFLMPILALLEPSVRAELVPAALEAAGGFAILAGAIRWSQANAKRAIAPVAINKKQKVRVSRSKNTKKTEATAESLVPGDEIQLGPGDDVAVDGVVLEGSGFVDETALTGPTLPAAKKPGDAILAGSDTSIPELFLRVETPSSETFLAQREAVLPQVVDDLARAGPTVALAFALCALLTIAGAIFVALRAGIDRVEDYLPELAAIMLATATGPAGLALIRGRLRILAVARAAGVVLTRAKDVLALANVRRWQIDANLLVAPGDVEAVALTDVRPDRLLLAAEALLTDEKTPEAISIRRAVEAKKLERLQAAALRRDGPLYQGTVDGRRWFMGPQRAVEEEEKLTLDKTMEGPITFLRDRGMITWLIGQPGEGVVGAIGIGLEADLDAKTTASKLRATVLPGPPDSTRQALATKAGIRCDGPPLAKRDASLLTESTAPPSSGLRVRVLPVRTGIAIDSERSPRLLLPSLGNFGDTAKQASRAILSANLRAVVLAIVPGIIALALALGELLTPSVGALISLFALLFSGPVSARSSSRSRSRS